MSYEGVKYETIFIDHVLPTDDRIGELRNWCSVFHEKDLAPHYPGGTHGNMSYRVHPQSDEIVITSARSSFAKPLPDDSFFLIHKIDFEKGEVYVSGAADREPSSETLLHYAIYQQRPDVQAILHGHCTSISKYAFQLGLPVTHQTVESGTMKITESVLEILQDYSFIEIRDHGFMSLGKSIEVAGELSMEILEKSLKVKG